MQAHLPDRSLQRRLAAGRPAAAFVAPCKSVVRIVGRQQSGWHCRPCTRYCILSRSFEQASCPEESYPELRV